MPQLEQPPPFPSPAAFSHAPDFGSPSRGGSPPPSPRGRGEHLMAQEETRLPLDLNQCL